MTTIFRNATIAATAVAVLLLAGACAPRTHTPTGKPAASASTAATTAESPSSEPAGEMYDAAKLDVCGRTDLSPLAELSLTVKDKKPTEPASGPGAACLFEMRSHDGHEASLLVEATTLASADEAGQLYRATQTVTVMTPDGELPGLADEAAAFTRQSEPGFKHAEYMAHARSGNLVVKVWLAVGGKEFTPKTALAPQTQTILKATLALVPRA